MNDMSLPVVFQALGVWLCVIAGVGLLTVFTWLLGRWTLQGIRESSFTKDARELSRYMRFRVASMIRRGRFEGTYLADAPPAVQEWLRQRAEDQVELNRRRWHKGDSDV